MATWAAIARAPTGPTAEAQPGGLSVAATYGGFSRLSTYTRSGDPAQTNGPDDRVTADSGGRYKASSMTPTDGSWVNMAPWRAL